ncbi:MAG: hypothetical protein KDB80_08210, partial [Planctomycetes bacterium]|nr:hypothetical protein [Planctomycetota bacterium]
TDEEGMLGRECPAAECKPKYFKVKPGTGQTDSSSMACPYCAQVGDPQEFSTESQRRYARDLVSREAQQSVSKLVDGMLRDAFGLRPGQRRKSLGDFMSIELTSRRPTPRLVTPPVEQQLRRDLVCPVCSVAFAVFGLATWCPDCGSDLFLEAVEAEFKVVRAMLGDVQNRRERLGARVAARDLENALEDVVSTFEAVARRLVHRRLLESGMPALDAEKRVKKCGNAFQSVSRATIASVDLVAQDVFAALDASERTELERTFEARHPVTHNAGVVDRKYLDKSGSLEREGHDVAVTTSMVTRAMELAIKALSDFHERLFPTS